MLTLQPFPHRTEQTQQNPRTEQNLRTEFRIEAELSADTTAVHLAVCIFGPISKLLWTPSQTLTWKEGLWEETCVELFLKNAHGPEYWEWNFAPSYNWWCMEFAAYRRRARPAPMQPDLSTFRTEWTRGEEKLQMLSSVPRVWGAVECGVSCVLKTKQEGLSYWALAHPSEKPDFHKSEGFVWKSRLTPPFL